MGYEPFLLAVDPGNGTGWAVMGKQGETIKVGICRTREAVYDMLNDCPPVEKVIMEDYTLFQHKAIQQSGSKLETVRVIGVVEEWAHRHKVELILQPANILPIAKLWSGLKPTGAHKNNHHISALLHGYYYLQKNGYIKPKRN